MLFQSTYLKFGTDAIGRFLCSITPNNDYCALIRSLWLPQHAVAADLKRVIEACTGLEVLSMRFEDADVFVEIMHFLCGGKVSKTLRRLEICLRNNDTSRVIHLDQELVSTRLPSSLQEIIFVIHWNTDVGNLIAVLGKLQVDKIEIIRNSLRDTEEDETDVPEIVAVPPPKFAGMTVPADYFLEHSAAFANIARLEVEQMWDMNAVDFWKTLSGLPRLRDLWLWAPRIDTIQHIDSFAGRLLRLIVSFHELEDANLTETVLHQLAPKLSSSSDLVVLVLWSDIAAKAIPASQERNDLISDEYPNVFAMTCLDPMELWVDPPSGSYKRVVWDEFGVWPSFRD